MPLPLLIGLGVAAAGALVGVTGAAYASSDNDEAEENNNTARNMIRGAKGSLTKARNKTSKSLENLGNLKIEICETSISKFLSLFQQIKQVKFQQTEGLKELSEFAINKESIVELRETTEVATSVAQGLLGGSIAGGAIAFGAWSAASAFATASTGTAIATLSGAAATNATLAFFGGGALAAGGLGMAGGAVALGGFAAGPLFAVLGIVSAANARENLENSEANLWEAREFKAEIDLARKACVGIQKRADLFSGMLTQLDRQFSIILNQMEKVIQIEGTDYRKYSDGAKKTIAASLSLAQAIKAILDTPILTEKGNLTRRSKTVSEAIGKQLQLTTGEKSKARSQGKQRPLAKAKVKALAKPVAVPKPVKVAAKAPTKRKK